MNLSMLRIALVGSRSAWGRLAGIAAGVAVGTAMFLILLGAYKGLERRDDRGAMLKTVAADEIDQQAPLTGDNALFASVDDYLGDRRIDHFEIAVTPDTTISIPGLQIIPGPGEFLASPALQRLIGSMPPDQLADRYGTPVGTIPDALLESPDSLLVIVGRTEGQLLNRQSVVSVTDFSSATGSTLAGYRIIVIIGAIGMFFPVLLFISIVTQLGAVQRQERFAALRLIGASSQTVSWFAAIETAVTSSIGALLGVAIAIAFRPVAAATKIDGKSFFVGDFAVGAVTIVAGVLLMVLVSTLAAGIKIRRTGVSPINTVRDIRETPPSLLRGFPLLAGLAMIGSATLLVREYDAGGNGVLTLFIGGFLLLLVGIVLIGPLLTLQLSRLLGQRSNSAATLIAARRMSATPGATFRSVSGLVVAVFVVTVFAGSASAVAGDDPLTDAPGLMPLSSILVPLSGVESAGAISAIRNINGVESVVTASADPAAGEREEGLVVNHRDAELLGFVDIPDSEYVSFHMSAYTQSGTDRAAKLTPVTVANPEGLVPQALIVGTAGDRASIERVRTALMGAEFPEGATTRADIASFASNENVEELKVLAYLGVIVSILIAGSSLAIATACAMLDRKRILGLMRLMGMPEGNLQKIVAIEAAVPLVAVLGMVVALGFGVAWCIVEGTSDFSIGMPDRYYFLSILFGLTLALAMIAATFGLVRRNTLVSVTRFE